MSVTIDASMQKNTLLFVIIGTLAGFIGGFLLANSLNRSAFQTLRPQTEPSNRATSNSSDGQGDDELSANEIRQKIAEADKNPANFEFQKNLGVALYRYFTIKQDPALLKEAARILDRANSLNGRDFDVLVALGNARFDIGFAGKDASNFQAAREIYAKALEIKPGDPDVMTDYGLSYFIQEPPSYDKATAELQKVAAANPKHERSLQFLVRVFIKQNRLPDAEKALQKLQAINPSNDAIPELQSQLSAARGEAK
jgi:tetratricopeptide (TPR) repeat protein